MDFYEASKFLRNHVCGNFFKGIEVEVVKVCPDTLSIDYKNPEKNTMVRVWLESGPEDGTYHDMELDCGGASFEEAVITMAELVLEHYGPNGEKADEEHFLLYRAN